MTTGLERKVQKAQGNVEKKSIENRLEDEKTQKKFQILTPQVMKPKILFAQLGAIQPRPTVSFFYPPIVQVILYQCLSHSVQLSADVT